GQGITFPDAAWNQQMTFPVDLRLERTADGLRLFGEPVRELRKHLVKRRAWTERSVREGAEPLEGVTGDALFLRGDFELGTAANIGFVVRGVPVSFDAAKGEVSCGQVTAPLKAE